MNAFLAQIRSLWGRLSPGQKAGGAALVLLILAAGLGLVIFGGSAEYRTLAQGLDRAEAQKVLARLDEAGIPYRIRGDGRDVEVPASRWDEVQRVMVQNNLLARDSGKGYAGLSDIPFGRTEAQLKLELKKAQEEQLALTLQRFEGVEEAVVHITPAARSLTKDQARPAKASVMVRSKPGRMLPASQVEAVVQLVSHAVDGLEPGNVVVTDFRGSLLLRPENAGRAPGPGTSRFREVEQHLQEKAESALARALGPEKAVVRVDAELDLEKVDTTRRTIDPESKVVVNESLRSVQNKGTGPRGSPSTAAAQAGESQAPAGAGSSTEDTESTYRYGEAEIRTVKEMGQVRRLTVGVMVDEGLKDKKESIEGMVKGAVGFNPTRGDLFEIAFVPFAEASGAAAGAEATAAGPRLWMEIVRWAVTGLLGAAFAWFVFRSARHAKQSLRTALERVKQEAEPKIAIPRKADPKDEFRRIVDEDVETVGKLLRNWLYEPVKN